MGDVVRTVIQRSSVFTFLASASVAVILFSVIFSSGMGVNTGISLLVLTGVGRFYKYVLD